MKMRLVRGRWFSDADDAAAPPVVLVNETAVQRYWPHQDPLLSRVRMGGAFRQVVGVVADTKHFGLDQAARPAMYFPYAQLPLRVISVVVRTEGEPSSIAGSLRAAVREIDPGLAVSNLAPMQEVIARTVAAPRVTTTLLAVFALSALLLSAIGLYGVMSYAVGRKTHEIGIRMALGARQEDVLRWSVGLGMKLLAVGAGLGITAALVLSRFMKSLLFGVAATDLAAFAVAVFVLASAALLASYLPARRAARVDPVVALRCE
jgi:putative ABC transport system permease protein